jgi:hypothetical protein
MASERVATTTTTKSSGSRWFFGLINIAMQLAVLGVLVWIGIFLRLIYERMEFPMISDSSGSGLLVFIAGTPTVAASVVNTPTVDAIVETQLV